MSHRIHRHRRHKLKGSEKTILLLIIPISLIIAIGVSVAIRGIPNLYWKFINNFATEAIISRALVKGSAVRHETTLRKGYEKEWRKDSLETWSKSYETMMQNKDPNEIKEIERKLKETKKGIY